VTAVLLIVYPWIKALHIVSVVAWMAGLLYLPRLFVYHADAPAGSDKAETFKIMERRLLHGIMNPALLGVVILGTLLAVTPGLIDWRQGWIWTKLALVAGLFGFHHALAHWRKQFAADRYPHTARFFRAINELPMLALIAIVILVVVKPF
jgi:protoporphyrinogen IX oxidase